MVKNVLRALGVLAMVVAIAITCRAQTREITILHTNDTHSTMVPISGRDLPVPRTGGAKDEKQLMAAVISSLRTPGPIGTAGIARMATLIGKIKAADPNVLVLNAGDVFVGTFEFNKYLGYPELKIMEGLYDAMCLGNHEADLGLDILSMILGGQLAGGPPVTLPILCANLDLSGTVLTSFVQPSITKTVNGVKIGIVGLLNPDSQNYSAAVAGRISDPLTAAGIQAATLRAQGCQVVIALSHLGTAWDTQGLVYVPGIDVIVGGHSHAAFTEPIVSNGKIIVQAGEFGKFLGELKIDVAANGAVTLGSYVLHPVDSTIPENPTVKAQVNELRDGIVLDPRFGPVFSQMVAVAAHAVSRLWPANSQNRDSALGNLVADAMRIGANKAGLPAELALDSFGYIAAGIPAGKVVGEDIMRAVPYGYDPESGLGFKVVVAPLPGALILGGLEYAADLVTDTTDLAIQVSGITYTYDSSKPKAAGLGQISRLDPMSVKVGDEYVALNQGKYYMVAMSEQVFNFLNSLVGGSLINFPTNQAEYTLVRDYMRTLKTVDYSSEGRVKDTAPLAVR